MLHILVSYCSNCNRPYHSNGHFISQHSYGNPVAPWLDHAKQQYVALKLIMKVSLAKSPYLLNSYCWSNNSLAQHCTTGIVDTNHGDTKQFLGLEVEGTVQGSAKSGNWEEQIMTMITLYHYTNYSGYMGIQRDQKIRKATRNFHHIAMVRLYAHFYLWSGVWIHLKLTEGIIRTT